MNGANGSDPSAKIRPAIRLASGDGEGCSVEGTMASSSLEDNEKAMIKMDIDHGLTLFNRFEHYASAATLDEEVISSSTSAIIDCGALSPRREPILMMRV